MQRHVFISYSSHDQPVADGWRQALEAQDLACWIAPRDILPSADWAEQIIDGIDAAWAVLLILSEAANQSPQVRREVGRAVHKQVAILPLRIHDVTLSKSLEYFLSAQHWVDAVQGTPDDHLPAVARALRSLRPVAAKAVAVKALAPVAWKHETLTHIEQRLALHVGPVASVLVQRAAKRAQSKTELVELLANDIDDLQARAHFRSVRLRD